MRARLDKTYRRDIRSVVAAARLREFYTHELATKFVNGMLASSRDDFNALMRTIPALDCIAQSHERKWPALLQDVLVWL